MVVIGFPDGQSFDPHLMTAFREADVQQPNPIVVLAREQDTFQV
jgi:hypothetical protein